MSNPAGPRYQEGHYRTAGKWRDAAQELIRKLDEESDKKLEQVSAEKKLPNQARPETSEGRKREDWRRASPNSGKQQKIPRKAAATRNGNPEIAIAIFQHPNSRATFLVHFRHLN